MDFKSKKLIQIVREWLNNDNERFEINGIDLTRAIFFYRERYKTYLPIPKGNYQIRTVENNTYIYINEEIKNKAYEYQIIYEDTMKSSTYDDKFPELSVLVEKYNDLVNDVRNIILEIKTTGIKADSINMSQILAQLEPLTVWYADENGEINTMPIESFSRKLQSIMDEMEEVADEKAKEKVEFHMEILQNKIKELNEEIDSKLNESLGEIPEEVSRKIDEKLGEIDYETAFDKNTAFNKNFGTTAGTVLEGNYCPYAVGDIYITTNTSNPATLWIGTGWEKIEGRFLRATNRGESAGINGGSDIKTLTLENLPSHTHSATAENAGYHTHTQVAHSHTQPSHKHAISRDYSGSSRMAGFASNDGDRFGWTDRYTQSAGGENTGTATPSINGNGRHTHSITVSSEGSGTSFDIKPAYYTVNIWKRTR